VAALVVILCVGMFGLGRSYQALLSDHLGVNEPIHGYIVVRVCSPTQFHDSAWHLWYSHHNVITTVGRNASCDYLFNQTFVNGAGMAFYYIAIGTGTGGGTGSTALVTEFTRATATYAGKAGVTYNCTLTKTWAAGTFSGQTISEAGVFNAAAAGILFNDHSFTGITLAAGDSLQVTFEFQIGS
jgi:hypothetical protein